MQTKPLYLTCIAVSISFLISCSYVNYTPRNQSQRDAARPSPVLLNRIIEFREKYFGWPVSKDEFIYKDPRYKEAFAGFPYLSTQFKIIDGDNMIFYFDQHIKDEENYKTTGKTDLNAFHGKATFYKQNGTFIWKVKMY